MNALERLWAVSDIVDNGNLGIVAMDSSIIIGVPNRVREEVLRAIVREHNCHRALLNALKRARTRLPDVSSTPHKTPTEIRSIVEQVEAAIAAAEKGTEAEGAENTRTCKSCGKKEPEAKFTLSPSESERFCDDCVPF